MDENQAVEPQPTNKYVDLFKRNKYLVFFLAAGVVLLIIILWILAILLQGGSTTKQKGQVPTITASITPPGATSPTPARENVPTIPIPPEVPPTATGDPESPTLQAIRQQLTPQINVLLQSSYDIPKIKEFPNDWALVKVRSFNNNYSTVIAKKENNTWKVIAGPGSFFDPADLKSFAVPQTVIDEANSNF